jgi:multidrug resistance efflux pump
MSEVQVKLKPAMPDADRKIAMPPGPIARGGPKPRRRILPVLLTAVIVVAAAVMGRFMWQAYMGAPWTRDATVRAYVVTMAPEVAGRVVALPVHDNQFIHKGDLLLAVDPTNYSIAADLAGAAVQQAEANVQNIDAQVVVQQAQISASQAQLERAQAALVFAQQQAVRYKVLAKEGWGTTQSDEQFTSELHQQEAAVQTAVKDLDLAQRQVASLKAQRIGAEASIAQAIAQLNQAKVNLGRTRILSPVDGYVTNLQVQTGDFATAGISVLSVVDAHSYWVDGYFEETNVAPIRIGDPAEIKLMGYSEIVRGHVDSIARAIDVPNAQSNAQGVATVNPIFTWVRLAQRIPVHIHIDEVPADVVLVAGMTATVEVDKLEGSRAVQ